VIGLDNILPELYRELNVPADRLVTDAALGDRFVELVHERSPDDEWDKSMILHRLITMRKKGQLPRLRR
jgi:hypothetical protein